MGEAKGPAIAAPTRRNPRGPSAFRDQVERLLIERSIAIGWILICISVLMSVLFCVVYLTSLRDPAVVRDVLSARLVASAVAGAALLILSAKSRDWIWRRRRRVKALLIGQEIIVLLVFGATATMWMGAQAYAVNATTVTGICAFAVISGSIAPRFPAALIAGRLALLSPVVWFCVATRPPLWWLLTALCLSALIASYAVAFALHGQHRRQAVLATRLRFARRSATRALRGERMARARLEEESALRERFLHAVTHDLGQPLQALNLHLRRLKRGAAETTDKAAATGIERFAEVATVCLVSANGIIDSVAGSAWLRQDLAAAELEPLPLQPLLDAAAREVEPLAEHHGLIMRVAPTSLTAMADREFLERVIRNLVRNAIQHARRRILIGARRKGAGEVEIVVQDDGSGVPADMRDAIFEPFRQVRASARRDAGNVGLGLSIVQDLVGRMGGSAALRSEEGKGARFSVRLARAPRSSAAATTAEAPAGAPTAPPAALIIDDQPDHAEATRAAVEAAGGRGIVFDGAFEAAAIAAAIDRFRGVVLLDFNLSPDMTAHAALDRLDRLDPRRILIVTSDQSPRVLGSLRARGLRTIIKPIRAEEMRLALAPPARGAAE